MLQLPTGCLLIALAIEAVISHAFTHIFSRSYNSLMETQRKAYCTRHLYTHAKRRLAPKSALGMGCGRCEIEQWIDGGLGLGCDVGSMVEPNMLYPTGGRAHGRQPDESRNGTALICETNGRSGGDAGHHPSGASTLPRAVVGGTKRCGTYGWLVVRPDSNSRAERVFFPQIGLQVDLGMLFNG
jgi:hypothetical protein